MPRTDVVFYQEDPEDLPVLDWLRELPRSGQPAYESCVAQLGRWPSLGMNFGDRLRTSYETASTSCVYGRAV